MCGCHLWIFEVGADADERCCAVLNSSERSRAEQYRLGDKARQFRFARSIGRRLLGLYWDCDPSEVSWALTGPPDVKGPEDTIALRASLSHSGQFVAVTVSRHAVFVGVDIEELDPPMQPESLVNIAFTEEERAQWACIAIEHRAEAMRRIWTVKEAVLKSPGRHEPRSVQEARWLFRSTDPPDVKSFRGQAEVRETGEIPAWQAVPTTTFLASSAAIVPLSQVRFDEPPGVLPLNDQTFVSRVCGTVAIDPQVGELPVSEGFPSLRKKPFPANSADTVRYFEAFGVKAAIADFPCPATIQSPTPCSQSNPESGL